MKTRVIDVVDDDGLIPLDITSKNGAAINIVRFDTNSTECNFVIESVSAILTLGRGSNMSNSKDDYSIAISKENINLTEEHVDITKEGLRVSDGFRLIADGCKDYEITIKEW